MLRSHVEEARNMQRVISRFVCNNWKTALILLGFEVVYLLLLQTLFNRLLEEVTRAIAFQ
jgi:hypothetical protein